MTDKEQACPYNHHVAVLYYIPVTPRAQLPTHCVCGTPFEYADVLGFASLPIYEYDPAVVEVTQVTQIEFDVLPMEKKDDQACICQ